MITRTLIMLSVAGPLLGTSVAQAQVQFQVPPQSLALEAKGTLEAMQGNLVKFKETDSEQVWLLKVDPRTQVSIEGEADVDYLRTGMTVELVGDVNEQSKLAEPIEELRVLETKGRPAMGLFNTEDDPQDAKPLRSPDPGTYRIRGRIKSVKDREIEISAGRFTVSGTAGEEFKAKLSIDNPRLAKPGDTMQVKAWYYDVARPNPVAQRPGQALAESLSITLSQTPEAK
jgi:hypothetical protein